MLDLMNRPAAPARVIDPIMDIIAQGGDLTNEEIAIGKVGQSELDMEYEAAFASYVEEDVAWCDAYFKQVGEDPPGERAEREQTQREVNLEKNGGVKAGATVADDAEPEPDKGNNGRGNGS